LQKQSFNEIFCSLVNWINDPTKLLNQGLVEVQC